MFKRKHSSFNNGKLVTLEKNRTKPVGFGVVPSKQSKPVGFTSDLWTSDVSLARTPGCHLSLRGLRPPRSSYNSSFLVAVKIFVLLSWGS